MEIVKIKPLAQISGYIEPHKVSKENLDYLC